MSGTNHIKRPQNILPKPQPRFVFVRPQMGENIGTAARSMWNFGLEFMTLVSPRDGWPNPQATILASGAARVLDQVQLKPSIEAACSDLHVVFATSARDRDLQKPVLTPEEAMQRAHALCAAGQKVGFLFGPERAGLENGDLVNADAIVSVPVNPAFASLNLGQSVTVLAYEWGRQASQAAATYAHTGDDTPSRKSDKAHLVHALEILLEERNFFWPMDKSQRMRLGLRNLIARLDLADADIRMLHGIFRALVDKESKKNEET